MSMIEFYKKDALICSVEGSFLPAIGSFVNIRKKTWKVKAISFAVDNAGDANFGMVKFRANIDVQEG